MAVEHRLETPTAIRRACGKARGGNFWSCREDSASLRVTLSALSWLALVDADGVSVWVFDESRVADRRFDGAEMK